MNSQLTTILIYSLIKDGDNDSDKDTDELVLIKNLRADSHLIKNSDKMSNIQ